MPEVVRWMVKYDSSRAADRAGWDLAADEVETLRRPVERSEVGVGTVVVEVAHEGVSEIGTGGECSGQQTAWLRSWLDSSEAESVAVSEVNDLAGRGRGRVSKSGGRRDGMAEARQALSPVPAPPRQDLGGCA